MNFCTKSHHLLFSSAFLLITKVSAKANNLEVKALVF